METSEINVLLNKSIIITEELKRKAEMFGHSVLILSLLDVVFGCLAIFCTALQATALFLSVSSLTAISICGRVVQLSKIRQLNKSLKMIDLVAIAWFVNKYKKYLKEKKVKMTKSTVLQKILTTIIAIFGVGGVIVGFLPQFTPIAKDVSTYCSMFSEVIAVASGIWLAGTHDKVLTAEEIEAEKAAKAEKEKAKNLEKAKAIVAEYENAKAIVAANEQKSS